MSDRELLEKAARVALNALNAMTKEFRALDLPYGSRAYAEGCVAITTLRTALAQPEPEPVAWNWVFDGEDHGPAYYGKPPDADITKQAEQRGRTVRLLYPAPPQRKPLTEEEIDSAYQKIWRDRPDNTPTPFDWIEAGIRYAERAHGIGGEA